MVLMSLELGRIHDLCFDQASGSSRNVWDFPQRKIVADSGCVIYVGGHTLVLHRTIVFLGSTFHIIAGKWHS